MISHTKHKFQLSNGSKYCDKPNGSHQVVVGRVGHLDNKKNMFVKHDMIRFHLIYKDMICEQISKSMTSHVNISTNMVSLNQQYHTSFFAKKHQRTSHYTQSCA